MRTIAHYIALGCFIFWLMPLGRFIAPSKEQQACGGQRAICLCSLNMAKPSAKMEGAQYSRTAAAPQKSMSAGASHDLECASMDLTMSARLRMACAHQPDFYFLLIDRSIDAVPKA